MIYARPNLNGNSPKDFDTLADDLDRSVSDLYDALVSIRGMLFHGRNYQTVSNPVESRQADLEKVGELLSLLPQYGGLFWSLKTISGGEDV